MLNSVIGIKLLGGYQPTKLSDIEISGHYSSYNMHLVGPCTRRRRRLANEFGSDGQCG